ncbi:unnamed protein product [Schistosoma margrebowiei]|uniref:Uncharacterized protein n=1 Tax=Schistosoma margrebowiei TaxID=48269 RepID=A0AA84ZE76_9TREM|nr:unnamed protein product [Schistosoma margrebowiei]
MKTSSKSSSLTENNGKSLDERKSTLEQTEKQYKESKYAVKKDLRRLNPQLDLKATEAEAKSTSDPIQRHNLERKVEDLRQKVNDYKGE